MTAEPAGADVTNEGETGWDGTPAPRRRAAGRPTAWRRTADSPGWPPARLHRAAERGYDVALLDLDGVVYIGGAAVPGAAAALAGGRGPRHAAPFVTNNASRTPAAIAAQLTRLGVPAAAARRGHLRAGRGPAAGRTAAAGRARAGRRREGLRIAVRERGLRPVIGRRGAARRRGPGVLARHQLRAARRGRARGIQGGPCSSRPTPMSRCPPRGRQPGNGSLVQVIVTATGQRPVVAGKPEPPLHAESVDRTGARRPLVVGDRLDTDIEGAGRVGDDSLLVLTGVTSPADVVLAAPGRRPSYLAADLAGLLEPHPEVTARTAPPLRRLDGAGRPWPRAELTGAGDAWTGSARSAARPGRPSGSPRR